VASRGRSLAAGTGHRPPLATDPDWAQNVDNGSAYRACHLALVCAKLGVTLIHARPFSPQGKGKLERWFRTVRLQLLPTLLEPDTRSLDALNQRLATWIEDEYLDTPHRGLQDATPREQ